jgi:hypothetical protein
MLIQSNFRDYYDAALDTAGIDSNILYNRFSRTVDESAPPEGWFENVGRECVRGDTPAIRHFGTATPRKVCSA